jgi:hypothetical protein
MRFVKELRKPAIEIACCVETSVIATQARRIADLVLVLGIGHESNIGLQCSSSTGEELLRLLIRQRGQDDHILTDLPVGLGDSRL